MFDSQKRNDYQTKAKLNSAIDEVDKTLVEYVIFDIDLEAMNQYLKTTTSKTSFQLNLGEKQVQLNLYLYDVLSDDFKHYEQTPNGVILHPKPEPFTYRGSVGNSSDKNVALAIRDNWIAGFFIYQNQRYFLTPLKQYDTKYQNSNAVVLYTDKAGKYGGFECGAHKNNPAPEQLDPVTHPNSLKSAMAVECTELAVAYDQGFKNLHNGVQGVENIIVSRLNMVANLYTNWFEIDYSLIELYEASLNEITPENNYESCQETAFGCSDGTVLDDFREWGEGQAQSPNFGNGFNSNPDVSTFWTSRDIRDGNNDLNIGYSHFEGICNDKGYNICEDAERYRGNEPLQMTLWAHEFGHTWNAYHVNQNNSYLMNSSVTAEATNVANSTINSIAEHKASRSCLSDGSCGDQCDPAQEGTACDDGDACTSGETYDANCNCTGGTFQDSDNDGVCDADDACSGTDDAIIGTTCDDSNDCTTNDVYDANCNCAGTPTDADGDGVCDTEDACPGMDDALIGTSCDDGDACTSGEIYDANCNCTGGTSQDSDNDGVCDAEDACSGADDAIIGTACDDGDALTTNDVYDSNCQCVGTIIEYCAANGTSGWSDSWIKYVELNTISNSSQRTTYSDFTNLVTELDAGATYSIRVDLTDGWFSTGEIYAWIDYNRDGTFDNNTELLDFPATSGSSATLQFTVPASAQSGLSRMRVRAVNGGAAPDPCGNYTGEVEDYGIDLKLPCTAGTACDDGDACTSGETYDANCNCTGGTSQDADGDGVCDADDACPGMDDALAGTTCDDGEDCTTDDIYDSNCNCAGTVQDADGDGVCDANDVCAGGDDNADADGDGTPDACDTCDDALEGTACDDGDACTSGETYDANCNCTGGTSQDADGDGVCDADDACPGMDDALTGTACDDGDPLTSDDVYDANCQCAGTITNIEYCSASGSSSWWDSWINYVGLSTISNSSQRSAYSDFTNLSAQLGAGATYSIRVDLTDSWFNTGEIYAWIDYNRDGIFDNSTELLDFPATSGGSATLQFTVPTSVQSGSTRMRVRAVNGGAAPDPCNNQYSGEVEDYGIELNGSSPKLETAEPYMTLYPNPADQYINLELHDLDLSIDEQMTMMIYALDGKQVYENRIGQTDLLHLDIAHLPSNQMYLLNLRTDDGRMLRAKFLKL